MLKSTKERPQGRSFFMLSRLEILSIRGTFMEHLWNFSISQIAKWKPIWKSPLWNFIIARNPLFANAKREVFAKNLRFGSGWDRRFMVHNPHKAKGIDLLPSRADKNLMVASTRLKS